MIGEGENVCQGLEEDRVWRDWEIKRCHVLKDEAEREEGAEEKQGRQRPEFARLSRLYSARWPGPQREGGNSMAFTTLYGRKLTQVMGMEEPAWQENMQLKKKEGLKLSSNKLQHLVVGGGEPAQRLHRAAREVFIRKTWNMVGGWQGKRRLRDGGAGRVEGWGYPAGYQTRGGLEIDRWT